MEGAISRSEATRSLLGRRHLLRAACAGVSGLVNARAVSAIGDIRQVCSEAARVRTASPPRESSLRLLADAGVLARCLERRLRPGHVAARDEQGHDVLVLRGPA